MNLLHQIHRIQQIGFDRSRSGPANIDAGDGARFCKDHGAAGRPFRARDLPDFDPGTSVRPLLERMVELIRPSCWPADTPAAAARNTATMAAACVRRIATF